MRIDDMKGREVTLRSRLTKEMNHDVLRSVLSKPVSGLLQFMTTLGPFDMKRM